jgi:hypothetical protein
MLTRRPLIPHLRVRAWVSGTEEVPETSGKGRPCSARSV